MSQLAKGFAAKVAAAGVVAAGTAVVFTATAAAEPPPVDPAAPVAPIDSAASVPPPAAPGVAALGPLGALPGIGGADFLLGQAPLPAGAQVAPGPNLNVLQDSQFLNPQNYRVPPPDQLSPYDLAAGTPGPFARVDALKGAHAMVHGALGRMPLDQLSQPLPGTAPPPGTQIPVGPEQNLPGPALLPVPAAAPLAPVPPPPAPAELPPPPVG